MSELGMDGMRGGTDVSVAHRVGGPFRIDFTALDGWLG
jgi:hypothetical protein